MSFVKLVLKRFVSGTFGIKNIKNKKGKELQVNLTMILKMVIHRIILKMVLYRIIILKMIRSEIRINFMKLMI